MDLPPKNKITESLNLEEELKDNERPFLSIVVPAYNEEGNLKRLHEELVLVLEESKLVWELILVIDPSTDNTWDEVLQLNKKDKRVKGIKFSKNFGHQFALFAGFNFALGKAIVTMDADLQHPPQIIPKLLEEWKKGYKIVNTLRIDHKETKFIKRFTSNWFYKIFSFLSGVNLKAGMADFRLLDEKVIRELLKLRESGIFLRGLVEWLGFESTNVEFTSRERFQGKTKYHFRKMIKFAWTGITSFSLKPLRLGISLGIITSIFSFVQLINAIWTYYYLGVSVPGWTQLIVVTTFLFGVLFIILGIIGEYIGRILIETRGRPRFIISESIGIKRSDFNDDSTEQQIN